MQTVRVAVLAAVLVAGSLVGTPAARAAVQAAVETTDVTGTEQLVLRSSGADTNVVVVRYVAPVYVIADATSELVDGPGCMVTDLRTVTCAGPISSAKFEGGDGADVIDFTGVPVPVDGDGGGGDDALWGGAERNTLRGADGVDELAGGPQKDDLTGDAGDDLIIGKDESDVLYGDAGDDIVQAGTGDRDVLDGGAGRDLLEGGSGADLLQGDAGDDVLVGGAGTDTVAPGSGDDSIVRLGESDRVDCPSEVSDGEITSKPCATVESGPAPEAWPPLTPSQATVEARRHRHRRNSAVPVVPGNASSVKVLVRRDRWKKVRRCLRTYSDTHHRVPLHPYIVRFKTKYWRHVSPPHLNPVTRSARLGRPRHCSR